MTRYFEYPIVSRPAIMFSVCMCARYQLAPQKSHLKAVKRILRYLYGTSKYRLWFSKGINCSLVGYSDSDFPDCKLDRKSTSGTSHFFLNSLVSWHNKKQFSVASSTSQEKYVATSSYCAQIPWLKQQLIDFDIKLDHISIMCENTSAINITKNPVLHYRGKHIEICHISYDTMLKKAMSFLSILIAKTNFWILLQNHLRLSHFSIFIGN